MTEVPITQVQAGRDPGRYLVHAAGQVRDDRIEGLRGAGPEGLLQQAKLHRDIPLHGHLGVRDGREQQAQVGEHSPLVRAEQQPCCSGTT